VVGRTAGGLAGGFAVGVVTDNPLGAFAGDFVGGKAGAVLGGETGAFLGGLGLLGVGPPSASTIRAFEIIDAGSNLATGGKVALAAGKAAVKNAPAILRQIQQIPRAVRL
jgi:hypothetical protein